MTLSYNFDQDDLLRWYRHSQKSLPSRRILRRRYVATWTGTYLGIASFVSLVYFQSWPAAIFAFGLAAALSFATRKCYDLQIEQGLATQAADPKLTGGFGPHQLILSDAGFREITPATESRVKWTSVTDVVMEAECIFVLLVTGQAAVISRRSYSGPVPFEEIPRVISELRQKNVA